MRTVEISKEQAIKIIRSVVPSEQHTECIEKLRQSKLFVIPLGTSNLDNAGIGAKRFRIFGKRADVAKLLESV